MEMSQIVTSQTVHTKYKWPSYVPEPNPPHENFLPTPLGACRFTSKPCQQLLTEASTGVDHTSARPDDTNQFCANGSCSAIGFHWETGKKMYDAFPVRGKKLEPERACTLCTCGERSKHFIENMMNLVLLYI